MLTTLSTILLKGQDFKSIKVGMTDKRVEALIGLPKEIFRGFNKLNMNYDSESEQMDYKIETLGQLVYICWRYDNKKQIILDTLREYIDKEDTTEITFDTLYYKTFQYHEDMQCSHFDYLLTDSSSRTMRVFRRAETEINHILKKKTQRILILNKCILFDPSSNRVVKIDYLPYDFLKRNLRVYNKMKELME